MHLDLSVRLGLEAFDDHQVDRRHPLEQFRQPRLGRAAQLMHQGPTSAGGHQHFGGAGLPVHPGILARHVDIETMVGVLDHRNAQAFAKQMREDARQQRRLAGTDQAGAAVEINVPVERPLTLYLNAQEIVTMMTIGDYPEYLALGYLLNQNMLKYDDVVTEVEYDDDLQVVVVRTEHHTNFEQKLKKRTQTSGCAQGTAFGDLLEAVESVALPKAELRTSWLYQMSHAINTMPSLYLEAGAIHGCVV